jgi:hypothetical protein
MPDIILEAFRGWTKNLGPRDARIAVFEHIRDIPYAIVPELRDPERGPVGLIERDKGSCQPKHFLLAVLLGKLNIPVKYATYPFKWGDDSIKYPADLKEITKVLPPAYHLACKAHIDGKWVLVDATFDPPLEKSGFPVNKSWDGVSDTLNAVRPLEEILHESVEGRVRYEAARKGLYTEIEKTLYSKFVDKLNVWLETVRK